MFKSAYNYLLEPRFLSVTTKELLTCDWREADPAVIDTLNAILKKSQRAGFWKCYKMMRLQGAPFNHKRVYRVF
jgi:hypothetical protein